jgi:uncharacterized membrane protein YhaH (DUF805 family)
MYALPKVDCCTAFKNAFKNYSNFSGRIRRSEYWFFLLVVNIVTFILLLFFVLFVTEAIGAYYYYYSSGSYNPYDHYYDHSGYYRANEEGILAFVILLGIYVPFITLPTLSASVRRLHDIGKSGCYLFIGFVPFFGTLTLLVFLCRDSMPEANEFGPPTKYTTNIINQTLQSPNQSYNAPLLPNDNNSINNVSSDNIIVPNNNINVVPNNNINVVPNNYIIVPNKNVIVPNNQYIVPNNQYIVPNKNIIIPNNNMNYVQNQNMNVAPNNNVNAVPNNNINSNNSKPVQMNELSEKKE